MAKQQDVSAAQAELPAKEVDACGLKCPEPVMLLHQALAQVGQGELVVLQATDPTTVRDVRNFCTYLGHQLVQHYTEAATSTFHYKIRKCSNQGGQPNESKST